MKNALHVSVLISGRGTNLQALIDACAEPDFPAKIVSVISNNPNAAGLEKAKLAGIKTYIVNHSEYKNREEFDNKLHETIVKSGADFVCLAGFMRLLTKDFVEKWQDRIINIHPSLLPAFKGANAQEDALKAGVKITGCTVHFVTSEMDSGPIILQTEVPILENDTKETLSHRILQMEHKIYPLALKMAAEGKVKL